MLSMFSSIETLAIFGVGTPEMVIVGLIAVLLFGSRLPSVARSLGKSFIEFKKGMRGIEEDMDDAYSDAPKVTQHTSTSPSAPRFEPPSEPPR